MSDRAPPPSKSRRASGSSPAAPAIDLSTRLRSPGRLVHDAHVRLRAGLVRVLAEAGHPLSPEEWSVLTVLWEQDGLTQLEVGERVDKDRHHTSRLVDALEQQGLVSRASTQEDRRLKRVFLTPSGRAVRPELTRAVAAHLEVAFEGVSQSDYDAFIRCLQHLVSRAPRLSSGGEDDGA